MMKIIGLTGPSGAGKGSIASLFAAHGIPSIDADAVYRELLIPPSPCLDELAHRFGSSILSEDGTLNRPALAALVFAPGKEAELQALNRISHRYVMEEMRRRLARYEAEGLPAVLVDAPQLYESGFDAECHHILAVLAPRPLRLARIMARDALDQARAEARLNAARPDEFFLSHADAVLVNDKELASLDRDVSELLRAWEVFP